MQWLDEEPGVDAAVEVEIKIPEVAKRGSEESIGHAHSMREILAELVELDPFKAIEDPVAWQREVRSDRPLVGRED